MTSNIETITPVTANLPPPTDSTIENNIPILNNTRSKPLPPVPQDTFPVPSAPPAPIETTTETLTASTTTQDTTPTTESVVSLSNVEKSDTSNLQKQPKHGFKGIYNTAITSQKNFIRKLFDNTVLNPYKCNPEGLMCDFVIIYIILMIIALAVLYIFKYKIRTKFVLAIDWILVSIIFTSGLLILTNMCLYKKPSKYAVVIIAIALVALYLVMTK